MYKSIKLFKMYKMHKIQKLTKNTKIWINCKSCNKNQKSLNYSNIAKFL
jgi:ribosomal protein L44E